MSFFVFLFVFVLLTLLKIFFVASATTFTEKYFLVNKYIFLFYL